MGASLRSGSVNSWMREPWPWIIIGLLGTTIIACMITLWLAISHPDPNVVDAESYRQIQQELRAQSLSEKDQETPASPPE